MRWWNYLNTFSLLYLLICSMKYQNSFFKEVLENNKSTKSVKCDGFSVFIYVLLFTEGLNSLFKRSCYGQWCCSASDQSVRLYLKWYNYSWFTCLAAKGKLTLLLY